MLRYAIRQRLEGYLVALIYFDSSGYKRSLTSKSKDSRRRNERCQMHKPSLFFFFRFSFCFREWTSVQKLFGTNYVKK